MEVAPTSCTFLGSDTSGVRDLKEKGQENSDHLMKRATGGGELSLILKCFCWCLPPLMVSV